MRAAAAPRLPAPRSPRAGVGSTALLLAAAACSVALVAGESMGLSTYPSNTVTSPFSGQGELPEGKGLYDYEIETYLQSGALLALDETRRLASLELQWVLLYDDARTVEVMRANYTSCQRLYCNARPSTILNSAGQPACCDDAYIPQAQAINTKGYATQTFHERWGLAVQSDERIRYFHDLQGKFSYSWALTAFPFDSHYLTVDVQTAFKPVLARKGDVTVGAGFSVIDGFAWEQTRNLRVAQDPDFYRPDVHTQGIPAWDVVEIRQEIVRLQRKFSKTASDFVGHNVLLDSQGAGPGFQPLPPGQWRGGTPLYAVRLYIKVQRRSTGFWVLTCILPVALVTIFGFGVQSLPRHSLKARAELLSTIFLSLVLLQTVLYQFLPPQYILGLPLMLVLVGYAYTLLLFLVIIVAHAMEGQWHRRRLKAQRRWASQVFSRWAERLEQGPCVQEALAQSAARTAAPLAVAREQIINPLQGSRFKLQEDQKAEPAVPDATPDLDWLMKQEKRWWFRIRPIRFAVEWWKFTGLQGSQEHCHLMAACFDQGARLVLAVTYATVVVVLCLYTASRSDSEARATVFPPE